MQGVPVGIGVRRKTLLVELRAVRPGVVIASVGNPGQDLVPEQTQQVETATGHRTGSGQYGTRGRRRPANDTRTNRLPPALAVRRRCRHAGVGYSACRDPYRNRKSSSSSAAYVRWVSVAAQLPCGPLLSAELQ